MTPQQTRPKGFLILAVILTLFALGTIAFWIDFFAGGTVQRSATAAYMEHEKSFPLADGYMAVCAFICAAGIIRRRSWGLLFGLITGSAIIFLGLMDTLHAINQGTFSSFSAEAAQTFLITATCLLLGPITIIYLWRKRDYLL